MVYGSLTRPVIEPEVLEHDTTGTELPAKVILYNDDWHTFEEVIVQLMKATGCSRERAEALTWEVHTRGQLPVKAVIADCNGLTEWHPKPPDKHCKES